MLYVYFYIKVAGCDCEDGVDQTAHRTEWKMTEYKCEHHADEYAQDAAQQEKREKRSTAGAARNETGVYAEDNDSVTDDHSQEKENEDKSGADKDDGDICLCTSADLFYAFHIFSPLT